MKRMWRVKSVFETTNCFIQPPDGERSFLSAALALDRCMGCLGTQPYFSWEQDKYPYLGQFCFKCEYGTDLNIWKRFTSEVYGRTDLNSCISDINRAWNDSFMQQLQHIRLNDLDRSMMESEAYVGIRKEAAMAASKKYYGESCAAQL